MEENTHKYVAKGGSRASSCCRAPHGARGLKHLDFDRVTGYILSRPARGAWIETLEDFPRRQAHHVAPRTGRVD